MAEKDRLGRMEAKDTALIVVDVQEKFVPHIHGIDEVVDNCVRLVLGCRELGLPIIVTEQYPKGLGHTVAPIKEAAGDCTPYEKTAFSIFKDDSISAAIKALGRSNLIICGIEAHVCLIKSVLDGLSAGYCLHWVADAISSRTAVNADIATQRAIHAGAFISSTEMALFGMLRSATDEAFRGISKIVK